MDGIIRNKIGTTYPPVFKVIGSALIIVGLLSGIFILFVLFLIIGGVFITGSFGVEIDISKSKVREYSSVFFIRWGKWRKLNIYNHVKVAKYKTSGRIYFYGNQSFDSSEEMMAVYLIHKSGKLKLPVKTFKSNVSAQKYAVSLSEKTGIAIVT